jgi:glutamine amidotransferase
MQRTGQMQAIRASIARGVPFLGICLGLQLLLERGEEGVAEVTSRIEPDASWAEGIGAIAGHVRRVDDKDGAGISYKVPHVGWNQVCYQADAAALRPLLAGVEDGSNFYFTHSYQGVCDNPGDVLATVTHASSFPAVIARGCAFGVQFHPEKSSHKGLKVLENFVRFAKEN